MRTTIQICVLCSLFATIYTAPAIKKPVKKLPVNYRKGYQAVHATSTATTTTTTTTTTEEIDHFLATTITTENNIDITFIENATTEDEPTLSSFGTPSESEKKTIFVTEPSEAEDSSITTIIQFTTQIYPNSKSISVAPFINYAADGDGAIQSSTSEVTPSGKGSKVIVDNVDLMTTTANVKDDETNNMPKVIMSLEKDIPSIYATAEATLESPEKKLQKRHAQFGFGGFGFGLNNKQQGAGDQNLFSNIAGSVGQISNQAFALANNAAAQLTAGFTTSMTMGSAGFGHVNQRPPSNYGGGSQHHGVDHEGHHHGEQAHHGQDHHRPDHHHYGGDHHHGGGGGHHHGNGHHHGTGGHYHGSDGHHYGSGSFSHGGMNNKPQYPNQGSGNYGGNFPGSFGGGNNVHGGQHGGIHEENEGQYGNVHGGSSSGDQHGTTHGKKPTEKPPGAQQNGKPSGSSHGKPQGGHKKKGDILFPTIPFKPIRPGSTISGYIENQFPVIQLNDNEIR